MQWVVQKKKQNLIRFGLKIPKSQMISSIILLLSRNLALHVRNLYDDVYPCVSHIHTHPGANLAPSVIPPTRNQKKRSGFMRAGEKPPLFTGLGHEK